jgi:hypothetical protein
MGGSFVTYWFFFHSQDFSIQLFPTVSFFEAGFSRLHVGASVLYTSERWMIAR